MSPQPFHRSSLEPELRGSDGRKRCPTWAGFLRQHLTIWLTALWFLSSLSSVPAADVTLDEAPTQVRLGIAQGMWSGVNINDAMAAIQAWTAIILRQQGSTAKVETRVFEGLDKLAEAMESGAIDGISLQSERFFGLPRALRPAEVFVAVRQSSTEERLILLSHRDRGWFDANGTSLRSIAIHEGPRTSLAPAWFESLVDPKGGEFALRTPPIPTLVESASRCVLGVYFRKYDSAIVTSNAFLTACELNPQLRKHLQIHTISPPFVPSVFFFRASFHPATRHQLEEAIVNLHLSTSGQQVLAVFQCDRMERVPIAAMDETERFVVANTSRGNPNKRSSLRSETTAPNPR